MCMTNSLSNKAGLKFSQKKRTKSKQINDATSEAISKQRNDKFI
jgi:hypothetical protein